MIKNENIAKSVRRKDKGNGSASKTKRKDGRYQGYIYILNDNNEKTKKYAYGTTQQSVKAKLEEIKKAEKEKPVQKEGEILFNDYAITFIEDIRSELAPRTIESYQGLIKNYLAPILKDKELNEIRQRDIQAILNRAHMSGRSVETRKRIQALTYQFFKNACVNNYIEKSPVVNLKKIKNNEDKIFPMILSEKEEKAFIEAIADSEYKVIFYLVLKTGMRISEALALEWTDIDYKNNIIKISKKVGRVTIKDSKGNKKSKILLGDPKSFKSKRDLKVPELLMKNLKEHEEKYVEKKGIKPFVFSTSKSTYYDARNMLEYLRNALNKYNKYHDFKIPMETGFHTLRHTLANRMYYKMGMKMLTICNYLGHYDEDFTSKRYVDKGMYEEDKLEVAMAMYETENERAKMGR